MLQVARRRRVVVREGLDCRGRCNGCSGAYGQVRDSTGAAAQLGSLLSSGWLLADPSYDPDWFKDALKDKGITPCILGRKSRGKSSTLPS